MLRYIIMMIPSFIFPLLFCLPLQPSFASPLALHQIQQWFTPASFPVCMRRCRGYSCFSTPWCMDLPIMVILLLTASIFFPSHFCMTDLFSLLFPAEERSTALLVHLFHCFCLWPCLRHWDVPGTSFFSPHSSVSHIFPTLVLFIQ